MNPGLIMSPELWQRMLDALGSRHHTSFLQSEVDYWRAEALRAKGLLTELENSARNGQYATGASEPPEPPAGTEFFSADGETRYWFRGDLGWYCTNGDCQNCPTQWVEVVDQLASTAVRRLPGGAQ